MRGPREGRRGADGFVREGSEMSLDVHAAVTSVVAPQHLAAGAVQSGEVAAATAGLIRSATRRADGSDTVDVSHTSGAPAELMQIASADKAVQIAQAAAAQIAANPALALQTQGNSVPAQVLSLVA